MAAPIPHPSQLTTIRRLLWLYFWLLIFEGALRKWFLPGLAAPLLIVRDPVVIAIYALALQRRVFPRNGFISAIFILSGLNFVASLICNGDYPFVTMYGLRANFLHLPLIFLIPKVFTPHDIRRIGYFTLLLAVPMAVLVMVQFTSSPTARINAGIGADSMQLGAGHGKIRPAGTFSFSNGLLCYISLLASFLFYSFFRAKLYPTWLVLVSMPSLLLMVATSGSRSVLSSVTIIIATAAFISIYRPRLLLKGSVKMIAMICIAYLVIGSWAVFKEGLEVMSDRIEGGGGVKDGLVDRYFGTLLPLYAIQEAPFLGYGIGMGTNVAAGLLTGTSGFLLAESEWERVVFESGALLGMGYILLRVSMTLFVGARAFSPLNRGEALPALLFAVSGFQLLNGQFSQATALGFGVFGAGICLAAGGFDGGAANPVPNAPPSRPGVRGRSIYSEKLHGDN
ncbi:MAG: hypothetical protein WCP06_06425 [Verrucomicrobiota bacterium]